MKAEPYKKYFWAPVVVNSSFLCLLFLFSMIGAMPETIQPYLAGVGTFLSYLFLFFCAIAPMTGVISGMMGLIERRRMNGGILKKRLLSLFLSYILLSFVCAIPCYMILWIYFSNWKRLLNQESFFCYTAMGIFLICSPNW